MVCAAASAAAQDLAAVDRFVASEMTRQKIPGAAVAIVRDGVPVKSQGYGLANVEHQVPVTPQTIFQSGSVGKQFTAAAVMLLVEERRLSLSDPLAKFVTESPAHWKTITVRHLLTHTSGLPDYTSGTIDYRRDYSEDELQRFAASLTPEFAPGSRWNYSNTGYVLLGIIIRKVSGQFYGDFLRDRVFAPAGMKTARIITEADIVPHRAGGYRLRDGELKNQDWVAPLLNTTADGSIYLSLDDLIAWDAAIRDQRVLKAESWTQVFTAVSLNSGKSYPYGFGWNVAAVAGHPAQRHGGSWQGFQTYVARFPSDKLTIIVLTNLAQASPERMADGIAAILDPSFTIPEPRAIPEVDPAMEARVRRLLADTAADALSPGEFAYVRAGFFPSAAKAYGKLLREAGTVTGVALLDKADLGDDRVLTYEIRFEKRSLRLRLAVAPDGKIAGFQLGSPPSR